MNKYPESNSILSERILRLRNYAIKWAEYQKPYIGQRIYGCLEGFVAANINDPWILKKATMLAGAISFAKPILLPGELLVGYNYYGDDNAIWNEISLTKRGGGNLDKFQAYLNQGNLTEEQIEFIMDVLDEIDLGLPRGMFTLQAPIETQKANQAGIIWAYGTAENHTVIGYEKVIQKGFRGILHEIEEQLVSLQWKDPKTVHRRLLLESARKIAEAACTMGQRYKEVVENRISSLEKNPNCVVEGESITDLRELVGVLDQVPEKPAQTFRQALQSLWFAHIINTWEDGINANSIGRIDQMLWPYYEKDLQNGLLTREDAFDLVASFWLKLYRDYDVQQAVLAGTKPNGEDATNELTYLMLDVTDALDLIRCLSVRLHKGSPKILVERALQVVHKGFGIPFFFNDDVMIPALVNRGISLEDARDYAAIGCVEITIPGKANPHAVSNRINLLKCLELALNNGKSMTSHEQIGPKTGNVADFQSMEDIVRAYHTQVEYFTDLACFESNRWETHHYIHSVMPYKSMLTEGCLESGKDFNAGGAKYNFHESMPMGIPNVADSLESIYSLVFRDKRLTLPQMVEQLQNNFSDATIRQLCLTHSAKYGNDQDHVDQYAHEIFRHFAEYLKTLKIADGLGFFAQPFTFLWLIEAGARTAATPDGRLKGDNLAYSLSPMQGRDISGLTAMINSLAKFPYQLAAGGPSSIVEIDPDLFNEKNFPHVVAIMQAAIEKGIGQLQFNVITAEQLREAQNFPDRYPNLAVRVSGFSQKFCLLERALQDHIIEREKHKSL